MCAVPALFCLTACSRHEKPKAPGKPVRTIAVAPTPAATLSESNRPAGFPAVAPGTKVTAVGGAEAKSNPLPSTSTPETRRALRERQRAFAEKMVEKKLAETRAAYRTLEIENVTVEASVRDSVPEVSNAFARLVSAMGAFDVACGAASPGFAAMKQEAESLESRLKSGAMLQAQGGDAGMATMSNDLARLNYLLGAQAGQRRELATADAAVKPCYEAVSAAQSNYAAVLGGNADYKASRKKMEGCQSRLSELDVRLSELGK